MRIFEMTMVILKIIEGWPFIYWISDGFREKFRGESLGDLCSIAQGLATANNDRFLRYWWEVGQSFDIGGVHKKWYNYAKGGPYQKWYGNNWTVVNWEDDGLEIRNIKDENGKVRSRPQNEQFYFKEGITYSATSTKGVSFRRLPINSLFDVKGSCIVIVKENGISTLEYFISLLNTKLVSYITDCLNATVETQVGDIKRVPFFSPPENLKTTISSLAAQNITIKKAVCSSSIKEAVYKINPIKKFADLTLNGRFFAFFSYENAQFTLVLENAQFTLVLLNEAIINNLIFEVYSLSPEDRQQVETQMGKPVGELPLNEELRITNSKWEEIKTDLGITKEQEAFVDNLPTEQFEEDKIKEIKDGFPTLYQSNNNLEEFCIRHQINPINVWYWFRESKVLPAARAAEIAMEFIAEGCRTILMEDEDGIIPITGLSGETRLLDRLEKHCLSQGFTSAQFMQLDGLLGKPLNEYIEHHFFRNFSDHLNLFMYLPKTPFIWHLSSGEHQGFEAYIIIYKWNRDSLFKLKTQYLSKRVENLEYRQIQLAPGDTAQAQSEKETIRLQLQEIAVFTSKIDELIAENYNPILDDGVGKNIAPLQKKGLLRCEVLNKKQLEKYLKADW